MRPEGETSWCTRTSVAVNRSTFCTSSLILSPAPSSAAAMEQGTPGETGGTELSMSSGIQLSFGFRAGGREGAIGFTGLEEGSGSALLLGAPKFCANEGNGSQGKKRRKANPAIPCMVLPAIIASTPYEPYRMSPTQVNIANLRPQTAIVNAQVRHGQQ